MEKIWGTSLKTCMFHSTVDVNKLRISACNGSVINYTGQERFSARNKCLFLVYFWTLNSNIFPEFLYHQHLLLQVNGWNLLPQDIKVCFYRGRYE